MKEVFWKTLQVFCFSSVLVINNDVYQVPKIPEAGEHLETLGALDL